MEFKDYYAIMGVSPEASQDEIKRVYRKLARKYHPDVSKEKNAEAKFKEVGEAYEVLKDPQKRATYDQLRKEGYRGGEQFTPPPGWQYASDFSGGGFTQGDASQFSDFFEAIFGGLGGGRDYRSHVFRQRGEDVHYRLPITLEEAYQGGTRQIQFPVSEINPQGQIVRRMKSLNVKIPKGVTQGQKIRLKGQGEPGIGGSPPGDLYLDIEIQPHSLFQVDGRDLTMIVPITPWEAALGDKIEVSTVDGKISVTIPPNSQTGKKLRIKGHGLPGNPPGDLYLVLQVVIPSATREEEKELYREMARKMSFNPRGR